MFHATPEDVTCFSRSIAKCFRTVCVPTGQHNVIICVLAATSDWESAAGISWAKQYDPSGERTLFVVTKIDKAEPGFRRSLDELQRDHIRAPSSLGYVLV